MTPRKERRDGTLRRDLNDMFRDANGQFALSKVIAAWGQALCGYLLIHHTDKLIDHPDTLAIMLVFLVLPDFAKKWLTMKYEAAK